MPDAVPDAPAEMTAQAEGRSKRAAASAADKAWKRAAAEPKEAPAPKAKKPKLDPNRVHPKAYTDMPTLRKLGAKYSAEQIEWCSRRFPQALRDLGWQVLPEDAGHNYSSYGEAHYMYAFAGQGIAKKGKHCVPYFSSRDDALTWWEQRLHDQARADSSAPLAALQRLKPLVQDANGVIVEAGGVRLQVQASNTRKATGYVGVTEKVETAGGKRTSVFVAKSVGEYLGAFGTAAEAARAYAQYMLSQARDAAKLAAPPLPPVAAAAAPPALPAPKRKTPAAAAKAPAKARGTKAPAASATAPGAAATSTPAAPDAPMLYPAPEAAAPLAPRPNETQKELALRLRLANAAADQARPLNKKMRPPPLPQHLEKKAAKPEPRPRPSGEAGNAGDYEGAIVLDEIRRREAELSGYREEPAVAEAQLVAPSAEDHRLTTVEVTWDDINATGSDDDEEAYVVVACEAD